MIQVYIVYGLIGGGVASVITERGEKEKDLSLTFKIVDGILFVWVVVSWPFWMAREVIKYLGWNA